MPYIEFKDAARLPYAVYYGTYKDKQAFIQVNHKGDGFDRILLADATHIMNDSFHNISLDDIKIYVDAPLPTVDDTVLKEKQRLINEQWVKIRELEAIQDDHDRMRRVAENYLKEKTERHKSQLRTVFYMLVGTGGFTHREKEISVRMIRNAIVEMLKNDSLDGYVAADDLPF